jgi:hypothetical protein
LIDGIADGRGASMLVLVLATEIVLAVFFFGILLIAVSVTTRHGDPSASYRLYAVRDKLISACVFEGVPRDNPWLETLYANVNSVLLHSNLLGGPKGWPLAVAVGQYQASRPRVARKLIPLPENDEDCPATIRALQPELRSALEHLSNHHMGFYLQVNAHARAQRRIQREKAKHLLRMMNERGNCGLLTFAPRARG